MIGFTRRVRLLDAWTALSSAGALVVIGPFRGLVEAFPPILFLSTIVLFMMPGILLAQWFLQDGFPGAALVPVAFVTSVSIFGLLGVPLLLLGRDLELYLLLSGAIVAASLVAAALLVMRRRPPTKSKGEATTGTYRWLWAPFLLLSTALAFVSWMKVPQIYDDTWVYLANIREFLNTDKLGVYESYFGNETGLSRIKINGWLLEQVA